MLRRMTTAQIPAAELNGQSRAPAVRPGRALATAIAWVFVAIGWFLGALWRGIVFCAISARYGYWRGLGLTDAEIEAKVTAPPPGDAGRLSWVNSACLEVRRT